MTSSYTLSESQTFTVTHARHMAAKVATDLKRMQRLYGSPSDERIAKFEDEVIQLLKQGLLGMVTYGFRRNGDWIEPTVRYTARDLAGLSANDDDPGRVRHGADVTGASFYSFLSYSAAWNELTDAQKAEIEGRLPLQRGSASEPGINGYIVSDRTYSSGGKALDRSSVRAF